MRPHLRLGRTLAPSTLHIWFNTLRVLQWADRLHYEGDSSKTQEPSSLWTRKVRIMHPNDPSQELIPVSAEKRLSENQGKASFHENYLPLQSSRCQRSHASVFESRKKKKGAAETPSALPFLSSHFRYWAIWSCVKISEANSLPHIGPSRSFCTSQAVQRSWCPELRVSVPLAYLQRCHVRAHKW